MLAKLAMNLGCALVARADGDSVNLDALGMDGFTPYIVERNPYWIALPALAIALLLLHLKRSKKFSGGKK